MYVKNPAYIVDSAKSELDDIAPILLRKKTYICFKRFFDVCGAVAGLIVCSPLLAAIAILIKLSSVGQIFFTQVRVGKNGILFRIYKFRTMVENAEQLGEQVTVDGDVRITRIGRILRKTKLDELPQLINVLRGEMSFVGPRPEVPKYVDLYTPFQRQVLAIRPGITDIASIRFRNENELLASSDAPLETYVQEIMPEKINYNLQYIHNISLWYDVRLIIETLITVVRG